jgi:hypothetical protein
MAVPNTKATLKEYCLRSLGKPVIDINVDDEQVDDRIDEAVQYFCQYHSDGVERMYLKYEVTAADITRMTADTSESVTENSVTTTWKQGNNFLIVPETVISVVIVFPLSDRANLNMFDVRYQLTAAVVTRMTADTTESITENGVTTTWKQGSNFLIVPETVISVVNVFPLSDRANLNMFDV